MPLKWMIRPDSFRLLEQPKISLAAPGSLTPRHRLTHALAADPTNFNLQYQLGVVASRAGNNERARDILERAKTTVKTGVTKL